MEANPNQRSQGSLDPIHANQQIIHSHTGHTASQGNLSDLNIRSGAPGSAGGEDLTGYANSGDCPESATITKEKKLKILFIAVLGVMLILIARFIAIQVNESTETDDFKTVDDTISKVESSDFVETGTVQEETFPETSESEAATTALTFALSSTDYYKVTGYTGEESNVVIPKTHQGKPVKKIDSFAFSGCTSLTSITIPDGVLFIGDRAFFGCTSLTDITIPNSVIDIGKQAFSGCTSLTSITIPDNVTSIGTNAFTGCTSLTSMRVAEGNYRYHSAGNCIYNSSKTLIAGCKTSVIPTDGSVIYIGEGAFDGCTDLNSITIPDTVTYIGSAAFAGCTSLTSITFPNSVTKIDEYAFFNCTNLTCVTIPDSVTYIGRSAFYGCTALKEIYYLGTDKQWSAITKYVGWDNNTGSYTIHFTS